VSVQAPVNSQVRILKLQLKHEFSGQSQSPQVKILRLEYPILEDSMSIVPLDVHHVSGMPYGLA